MFAKINSLGLFGLNAFAVQVETEISRGTPCFDIVGLADVSVKESRDRIKAAYRSCGEKFPVARVIVNLAPADTRKAGSMFDLAIFIAILKAQGRINKDISKAAFIGEVSLNGDVRGLSGVLPMVLCAQNEGFEEEDGRGEELPIADGETLLSEDDPFLESDLPVTSLADEENEDLQP